MMKSLSGILKQKKVKMVIAVIALVAAVHFLFMLLPYPELEVFLQREFSTRIYDRHCKTDCAASLFRRQRFQKT